MTEIAEDVNQILASTVEISGSTTDTAGDTTTRIALLVEYDGTDFAGFQLQKKDRSVQQVLEESIRKVYGSSARVCGCSRTDAGVHARGHVSHVDVPFSIPSDKIPLALNANLPEDVSVLRARVVAPRFHARFDAVGKRYTYRIYNARIRPCLDRRNTAHVPGKLDIDSMRDAAFRMTGTKDFSAFGARVDGDRTVNPIRTVRLVDVTQIPGSEIVEITVEGASFLYNMVRIIAGTLVYVGQGKITPSQVDGLFEKKDRRLSGKTMPASGLTLEKVFYEPPIF
ncbi:MAG: tRNA pseudouridine(38-40) synthase TruA [Oscillospiraceae bacterium]|nr:tRNA pseudouridine(38-40) synthase TruA [Oscillospiraceae bacterium]